MDKFLEEWEIGGVAIQSAPSSGGMKMSKQTEFTMESGTVYTLIDDHHFRIKSGDTGYEWAIKPWQWFAFDPEEIEKWDGGLAKFMDTVERKEPAVGRRILVFGKDEWRISTKIIKLEERDV